MSDLIEPMTEPMALSEQIASHEEGAQAVAMDDLSVMKAPDPDVETDREATGERDDVEPVDAEVKAVLEALLFVAGEPLSVERCTTILGQVTKSQVVTALRELQQDYLRDGRALQVVQVAGGYRLATKEQFAPWIRRLEKAKTPAKLSRSAVESLAIIAYRQPIVRGEIEKIRGVETSGVLRTLLERKLVRMVGRKEEPGRPIMYGTTKHFLEHFGLKSLADLPPLREFKELGEGDQVSLLSEAALDGTNDERTPDPGLSDAMAEDSTGIAPSSSLTADLHDGTPLTMDESGDRVEATVEAEAMPDLVPESATA
ncbi:MAG: SMC-Scp complex subunit ScpB [Nitrospiraceae bacterium]